MKHLRFLSLLLPLTLLWGCSQSSTNTPLSVESTISTISDGTHEFTAEIWADNWFSLYVNGEFVGEDSVSITTERSFNSETFTFRASYPLTIAMVTKDFIQNDTGLEYINTERQQAGDGGFIAQFTDASTGRVIATTDDSWHALVIHQAPLSLACEKSPQPMTDCTSRILPEPNGWTSPEFDDSSWESARLYSEDQIGVKEGYNDIEWSPNARLIWTSDLKIDNTILWRFTATR